MATAEGSGRSRSSDCSLCQGSGTLSWQQPQPSGVLRTIEMPCPEGCGDQWTYPEAERGRVIEQRADSPTRVEGNADEANRIGADFIRTALETWGFLGDNRDNRDNRDCGTGERAQ